MLAHALAPALIGLALLGVASSALADEDRGDEASADEASADEASADEASADEASADEASAEDPELAALEQDHTELDVFPHISYMHAGAGTATDFPGYLSVRNSLLSIQDSGRLAALDMGSGTGIKGGFAFEFAIAPVGYAYRFHRSLALGAMLGAGLDGVTGGRIEASAHARATLLLKAGPPEFFVVLRAHTIWLHRDSRQEGARHAPLAGDELRVQLEFRTRLGPYSLGLAGRFHEMLGTQFFGGSVGFFL